MHKVFFAVMMLLAVFVRPAFAQDVVYIQVEAQPGLARAETRARSYAAQLPDVKGFSLGGGWYGIALGPYDRTTAVSTLRDLRNSGRVPSDSYIELPSQYRSQFFPVGQAVTSDLTPVPAPVAPTPAPETPEPDAPVIVAAPEPEPEPDETLAQARRSEQLLTRAEREDLQIALKWAGFYAFGIDGAFGRGTRNAMAEWQGANGFEPTGVLTTLQRAALLRQYNAVLDGMDLQRVADTGAGITMDIPLGVMGFDRYEAPFAHYEPTGDLPAQVLLISQPGDQRTLFGLYEIMQTLEIVPVEGPRERNARSFTLEGRNDRVVSYTQAQVANGRIKGFTLVWPSGDEERRTRVLEKMRESFAVTDAVLDPSAISEAGQALDLVSGLRIRTPIRSRSGFFVDRQGAVLTTTEAIGSCDRITLDRSYDAEVIATDDALGLALLRPKAALAPLEVAQLGGYVPRLQSEIAVAGFSYEGALGAPTLTFGTLADLQGLAGEETQKRLALSALAGDSGGPVLDQGGAVLGLLLPRDSAGRELPQAVSFATNANGLRSFLSASGVTPAVVETAAIMAPEDLTSLARDMTVLVSCWR